MVPRGKVIETYGRDFIVKTPAGTKINIEFNLNGKFQEASGKNLDKGDNLEPGDGLLSLSTAAQSLQKEGLSPNGFWNLEEDSKLGWIYEFESALVDATSGKIVKIIQSRSVAQE
jgi:hypothetical protein